MEIETLFTEQKWNILALLAKEDLSPLQISEKLGSTISNVSQQLKLLEASELIKKKKISNRDKGKPRTLFSLSEDSAYVVAFTQGFAAKKLISANNYHKAILKIWQINDTKYHAALNMAYLLAMPKLSEFEGIFVSETSSGLSLTFVTDNSKENAKTIAAISTHPLVLSSGLKVATLRPESFRKKLPAETAGLIILHESTVSVNKEAISASKTEVAFV